MWYAPSSLSEDLKDKILLGPGGGAVRWSWCRYGLIRGRKETFCTIKAIESSGVEIRCNGRVIQQGLFRRIWNGRVHPSRNHFLVQVDLRAKDGTALPATAHKNRSFGMATPGWRPCFRLDPQQCASASKESRWKSGWCGCWHKIKAVEEGLLRVAQEEDTYRSLNPGHQDGSVCELSGQNCGL